MKSSPSQSTFLKKAVLALGVAVSLTFVTTPLLKADPPATAPSTAALPLDVKIEKATGKEKAYVVKLTNSSKQELKVTAKVLLAVAMHGDEKARHIPAHKIGAGKDWTIDDLAFDDHVVVSAEGFAPLEIKVK